MKSVLRVLPLAPMFFLLLTENFCMSLQILQKFLEVTVSICTESFKPPNTKKNYSVKTLTD